MYYVLCTIYFVYNIYGLSLAYNWFPLYSSYTVTYKPSHIGVGDHRRPMWGAGEHATFHLLPDHGERGHLDVHAGQESPPGMHYMYLTYYLCTAICIKPPHTLYILNPPLYTTIFYPGGRPFEGARSIRVPRTATLLQRRYILNPLSVLQYVLNPPYTTLLQRSIQPLCHSALHQPFFSGYVDNRHQSRQGPATAYDSLRYKYTIGKPTNRRTTNLPMPLLNPLSAVCTK
jgi:hypothetical protein